MPVEKHLMITIFVNVTVAQEKLERSSRSLSHTRDSLRLSLALALYPPACAQGSAKCDIKARAADTMPTGVEEASAILAFVQVGFSLAKTFTTLVGEYQEAPDELATLANAIVDTLAHIETVKSLLEENETTHGWNANGIDLATSCLDEAERLVKRIVTLLRKSGADIPPNDRIGAEDITISVMRRVAWSRFTGRIGKINESLAATRQKMLLVLTLYRVFMVDSQEQQRLARDRRASRDRQSDNAVAQDSTNSVETSQEARVENNSKTTAKAVSKLPDQLESLDEVDNDSHGEDTPGQNPDAHALCTTAETLLKDTKEASDSPDEPMKSINPPSVPFANRPAEEELHPPPAVEDHGGTSVDQEGNHSPNPGGTTIENLVVTACSMDDAALLRFGEASNPPSTADQVRNLLQKVSTATNKAGNDDKSGNEYHHTSQQHNPSSSHASHTRAGSEVGGRINNIQGPDPVASHDSRPAANGTATSLLTTVFGRLTTGKKVPAQHPSTLSTSSPSLCSSSSKIYGRQESSKIVHRLKLWHIGDWALAKTCGFRSTSIYIEIAESLMHLIILLLLLLLTPLLPTYCIVV
ncbi:hypothetical protein KC354_g13068 [Hortaea werneckii]|nr:hypothetical protein KC354_g13068 [Hortaea werneckii]